MQNMNHKFPANTAIAEKQILNAITSSLSQYISETDPYILFNGLLETLLTITQSEYGFIGEVFYDAQKHPYIKSYATTNISWSQATEQLYNENKRKGMIFSKISTLYGSVLKTGQLVIANQPSTDPRSGGLPTGHPPLNTFMGIPFYGAGELLGMVGLANRKNGYDEILAESLKPFLISCGNLIQAYRNNIKHQQVEKELSKYKDRLVELNAAIVLGYSYEFSSSPPQLTKNGQAVFLTRKELLLLEILSTTPDQTIPYTLLEKHIWKDIIVGESSLRSLLRHLRKKIPELTIKTVSGHGYMLITETPLSQKSHKDTT